MKTQFFRPISFMVLVVLTLTACNAWGQDLQEKFQEAQTLSQNGDYGGALKILRELEKETDNANIDFMIGFCLHASGELDEAIEYHKKAVDTPLKTTALYNLACAYSLKEDKDKAFEYLKKSIESGYHQPEQVQHAKQDPDFKNIKEDPRWNDMVAMMENDGKMPSKKSTDGLLGEWQMESGMKSAASWVLSDWVRSKSPKRHSRCQGKATRLS